MTTRDVGASSAALRAALEAELRCAEQQFGSEDFGEFTVDELDRRAVAGEWPWVTTGRIGELSKTGGRGPCVIGVHDARALLQNEAHFQLDRRSHVAAPERRMRDRRHRRR